MTLVTFRKKLVALAKAGGPMPGDRKPVVVCGSLPIGPKEDRGED